VRQVNRGAPEAAAEAGETQAAGRTGRHGGNQARVARNAQEDPAATILRQARHPRKR